MDKKIRIQIPIFAELIQMFYQRPASEQMKHLLSFNLHPARQLPKIYCTHSKYLLEVNVREIVMPASWITGRGLRRP
jgi:hypothetical protein